MTKSVVQSQDKYVLRLPDGMRDRLKSAAGENTRSMNAEIVHRLEQSFESKGRRIVAGDETTGLIMKYAAATESENEALKLSNFALEEMLLGFAHALAKAASGDRAVLDDLIKRDQKRSLLQRISDVRRAQEDGE